MYTKKLLPIFLLAALLSGIPADAKPKNFRTLQLLALKEMRETTIAAQKSDDIMIREIDLVANHLQRVLHSRTRTRGSEPLYMRKTEVDALQRLLARDVGANPYADNPYLNGGTSDAATAQPQLQPISSASNAHSVASSAEWATDSAPPQPVAAPPPVSVEQPSALKNVNVFETKPIRRLDGPRVSVVSTPDASLYDAASLRTEVPEDWRAEPGTIQIIHNDRDICFIWGAGIEGRPVFDRAKQRFKVVAIRVGLH